MLSTKSLETKTFEQGVRQEVGIVGCERLGLLHACLFAEAGFKVTCVDYNQATLEGIIKCKVPFLKHEVEPILRKNLAIGRLNVTSDLKTALQQSDIVLVTTSVIVDDKGQVDYSSIEKTLKSIGSNLRKGTLIIITSIVGIGAVEGLIKEILESSSGLRTGLDFYLAYSPILFPEKQTLKELSSFKRIVAALDPASLEAAINVIKMITTADIAKTQFIRVAEAAALFEAAFKNVNFALTNEFAIFCQKLGLDYLRVYDFYGSDKSISTPSKLPSESDYKAFKLLLEEAESHNIKLRVLETALESNKEALKHGVELIRDALKNCGKPMRRAKIALLGFSQTPNAMDIPNGSMVKLVGMLEGKGAKLAIYDPYFVGKTLTEIERVVTKKNLAEAVEGADCIVILIGHDQFKRINLRKFRLLAKMPAAVVDFEGVLDPAKVEAEGFIYRGFGRGVWKK